MLVNFLLVNIRLVNYILVNFLLVNIGEWSSLALFGVASVSANRSRDVRLAQNLQTT